VRLTRCTRRSLASARRVTRPSSSSLPTTLVTLGGATRSWSASVTKVVGKLEELGLVTRRADASDRRVHRVSLTDAGAALLAEVRQRKDVWLAARLDQLDEDRRARLADALDALDALTRQDRA